MDSCKCILCRCSKFAEHGIICIIEQKHVGEITDCPLDRLAAYEGAEEQGLLVRPVKRGQWIRKNGWSEGCGMGEIYGFYYECSICKHTVQGDYKNCGMNFCSNCGADMQEPWVRFCPNCGADMRETHNGD